MITEVDAPNFGIGAELFGAAFPEYFPTFQDVCVISYAKSFADVMIGNQHANPRLRQILDNFLEVLYRKRVNPRKRFVKKNKRRLQREGTGNFEPAAFPARKGVWRTISTPTAAPSPTAPATVDVAAQHQSPRQMTARDAELKDSRVCIFTAIATASLCGTSKAPRVTRRRAGSGDLPRTRMGTAESADTEAPPHRPTAGTTRIGTDRSQTAFRSITCAASEHA